MEMPKKVVFDVKRYTYLKWNSVRYTGGGVHPHYCKKSFWRLLLIKDARSVSLYP